MSRVFRRSPVLTLLALLGFSFPAMAQQPEPEMLSSLPTILEQIGKLESQRDPKCYATAARLEDFMFGTPLTEEARFAKAELQKRLVRALWDAASEHAAEKGETIISEDTIAEVIRPLVRVEPREDGGAELHWAEGRALSFSGRDVEHYTSIAYGYRAILAVQQELLLDAAPPRALSGEAVRSLRLWLDLVSLAVLHDADQQARAHDERAIEPEVFERAWNSVTARGPGETGNQPSLSAGATRATDFALTRGIIREKVAAFEAYNEISMPVFMRNLQVYFARFRWPEDEAVSDSLKIAFNESMIAFVADVLRESAAHAARDQRPFILANHVHESLQAFAPYRVNEYEDVIFFPDLPSEHRVVLEAYDTDSFRDSGLHWRYLEEAIEAVAGEVVVEPDPFAAELITEGVAQFGVLVLRVAGMAAQDSDAVTLSVAHLERAFDLIQERVDRQSKRAVVREEPATLASRSSQTPRSKTFFLDVSEASGIRFEHRMADWLNRMLRSYLKRSETEGTLTIPHAFGGAGVAAEDLNQDGLADILLLSGAGNALFVAKGDGTFENVTAKTPLELRRPDNTHGEPRQPIIADFDNDGLPDILIIYVDDDHRLYRNRGELLFEDVTKTAGLGGKGLVAGPATVCDIDGDGLLDLYIGYFGNYPAGVLPNLSRRNLNASPNRLFLNKGNFRFEDITAGSGADHTGWAQAMSHADLDGDGRQDLIVGNDFGVNVYLRNLGEGKFEDVTERIGTGKPSFAMNVGIADLNRDDLPDIYISNIVTMVKDEKYVLPDEDTVMKLNPEKLARMRVIEANDLFLSGPGTDSLPHYTLSDAVGRGFSSTGWSWDADFFDFDMDGDDDLYCLNGMNEYMVYAETPYATSVFDEIREIVLPVTDREPNVFFLNEGGRLEYASDQSGLDYLGNSRSAAYLDIDQDGDLDIIVNNFQGPALVYRNQSELHGNHWLKVKLIGDPEQQSNRDAIGARLIVTGPDDLRVWREIHGSEGYLSVHPREQHFGLGAATKVDLEIRWPNGEHEIVEGLEADRLYVFDQADGE